MLQVCLYYVDPWGDERADLRDAVNGTRSMPGGDEAERQADFEARREYIRFDDGNELYDEDALAAVRDSEWLT